MKKPPTYLVGGLFMEDEIYRGRQIILALCLKYNGVWEDIYDAIKRKERLSKEEILESEKNNQVKYVTIVDDNYPESLKNIYKPPFILFYYGDISLLNKRSEILSVVGTKNPSSYALNMTRSFMASLHGVTIASGFNVGINKAALETALDNCHNAIGVLPCGINSPFPKENFELYNRLKEEGLIISEYPNEYYPLKENMSFYNRIIAGVSKVIFVSECLDKCGTSVAINYAIDFGCDVAVLPHRIDEEDKYCNYLIQNGAIPITELKDLEELFSQK